MFKCGQCGGTGRIPCEDCHGDAVALGPAGPYRVPCEDCKGRECTACGGTGNLG